MGIGPVEYMVVAFPGNQFNGEIAPALKDLIDAGTIRVIDLAFVIKDADGSVVGRRARGHRTPRSSRPSRASRSSGAACSTTTTSVDIGDALEPNSSAAILVWEDLWAKRFADAVADSGGVLVDIARIPRDVVQAALDYAADEPVTA